VSAEFRAFAVDAARPITAFLRGVARELAGRTPGKGVGVIGMCFTGGFALATAVDDTVRAPVLSQPSAPFPVSAGRRRDPGVSAQELARVKERTTNDGLCLLGLRFSEDIASPAARFDTLKARLGDAFEVIELDSRPGNPDGFSKNAHSVLTFEVRTDPPNGAFAARERMVTFLREHLW
jgi:dienelactone hydrolase